MPRRNRRRTETQRVSLSSTLGITRTIKFGVEWTVRNIDATRAQKVYRCPGCPNDINIGQSHIVAWSDTVEDRRHWHSYCWRIAS